MDTSGLRSILSAILDRLRDLDGIKTQVEDLVAEAEVSISHEEPIVQDEPKPVEVTSVTVQSVHTPEETPDVPTSSLREEAAGHNISSSPLTWPRRARKTSETLVTQREYDIDETDRLIARLVIESGSWNSDKQTIAQVRRLTTQQVSGLKAVYVRTLKPKS